MKIWIEKERVEGLHAYFKINKFWPTFGSKNNPQEVEMYTTKMCFCFGLLMVYITVSIYENNKGEKIIIKKCLQSHSYIKMIHNHTVLFLAFWFLIRWCVFVLLFSILVEIILQFFENVNIQILETCLYSISTYQQHPYTKIYC